MRKPKDIRAASFSFLGGVRGTLLLLRNARDPVLYLTQALQMPDGKATETYSLFKAACYLLPLFGGILADRYFGSTGQLWGSVPYVIGQFILCLPKNRPSILRWSCWLAEAESLSRISRR